MPSVGDSSVRDTSPTPVPIATPRHASGSGCHHLDSQINTPHSAGMSHETARPPTPPSAQTPVSNASDSQSDTLGLDAQDRVFPIRSVVSSDLTSTPGAKIRGYSNDAAGLITPGVGSIGLYFPSRNTSDTNLSEARSLPDGDGQSRPGRGRGLSESIPHAQVLRSPTRDEAVPGLVRSNLHAAMSAESAPGSVLDDDARSNRRPSWPPSEIDANLVTARFKHVTTEGGHAVITGRDGETLQTCEEEPIHIPGAVQGFGLLLALQEVSDGKLTVRIVSENSKRIIGYTPSQLFALDNFCEILTEEQADNLLDHVDFIREDDFDPVTNGPEVFTLSLKPPQGRTQKLWCAIHVNSNNKDLIICELELEDDPMFPLVPLGDATPEPPEDTLESEPTAEELEESTINISRPLRVLRSARKRRGEAAAMEVFNIMSQVQEQLSRAPTLQIFLKTLVGVVKELTGFHRVMIYQFDAAWNGRVVAELVDPRATKDLYKGLNFPASDIPKQARDLYKINKVRLLYDRDQETARLVCRTMHDLENPLDLTHAYLRAMSPIHIKYLRNMAVRASMSVSISAFNELWGLISCHSYGSKGMRVSFPIRKMCRLVGDSASQNIERLSYASRLQARKLINTVPTTTNPSGYIIASSEDLLSLFDADCGLLSIRGETKILGKLEHTQEALAMLEYLRLRKFQAVIKSIDLKYDFPDLRYDPGFKNIAGLLLVPFTTTGEDFIVFFRKGQLHEVKWAGNPYEKFIKAGTEGYLEPRKSFKTWSETIVGKCKEWTEEQMETAAVLCLVYGKFIDVWRQKEAALQSSQLTRLLLANSAHEVRTPLNAIINYLEIALEGSIDSETRDNLTRSYSASKSLIYVINDLLDLTKTEEGTNLIKDEVFDLPATFNDATTMFAKDAKRKGLEYQATSNPGVPQFVIGDSRRVRQAIMNVVSNAIQHTSAGTVCVQMWPSKATEYEVNIDLVIEDTGCGMAPEKLDALFRELEQVQSDDDEKLQAEFSNDVTMIEEKETAKRNLGLGLALVARLIRNMNGQIRLKSEEGKGTRFIIQFVFKLPDEENVKSIPGTDALSIGPNTDQPVTPPYERGEVFLVNGSAQKPTQSKTPENDNRRSVVSVRSSNSLKSMNSQSSAKSDVDRMIEAMQEPTLAPRAEADHKDSGKLSLGTSSPEASNRHESTGGVGTQTITDSKTPLRPIRVPNEMSLDSSSPSRPVSYGSPKSRESNRSLDSLPNANKLNVLVAEDDPINCKIISKRLEKLKHTVHVTVNGEDCASTFNERPEHFDVILMDMQMPIVDGLTSTKMIRSNEKLYPGRLSSRAVKNGRVPIFAVSASLIEKERQVYIDAGFDAWILKPIDIKRLSILLSAIVNSEARASNLYQPGHWEQGGWFCGQEQDIYATDTAPCSSPSAMPPSSIAATTLRPKEEASDEERARLNQLQDDAVHDKSRPSNPGTSGEINQSLEE